MRNINEIVEEDEEENLSPFKLAEEFKESKKISSFSIYEEQKNNLEKQIKFLKKSNKNIITLIKGKTELSSNPFFQYRLEKNSINLFLINIYKKIRTNDIISITNNLISNNELLIKKLSESKKNESTLEKEINWVAQEKIDAIIEKERLSNANEILDATIMMNNNPNQTERLNPFNLSMCVTNNLNQNDLLTNRNIIISNNPFLNNKKLSDLKEQYFKMCNAIEKVKNKLPEIKKKIFNMNNYNNNLKQQIKQKKMIYEQLNNEIESLKEEVEKYKKNNPQNNFQNSNNSNNNRQSLVGKFFKGLFG
jgi:hypothetical protein